MFYRSILTHYDKIIIWGGVGGCDNYLPKRWKVLFIEPRFIEIFSARARSKKLEMNRGLEILFSNTLGN